MVGEEVVEVIEEGVVEVEKEVVEVVKVKVETEVDVDEGVTEKSVKM